MSIRSKLSSLREYLTPINNDSNFRKTGEISPEEFVKAGDYLVYKFPTWKWGTCPKNLQRKFLPPEKQFLVTKHVPSYQRVATYLPENQEDAEVEDSGDAEWVPRVNSAPVNAMKQQQQQQDCQTDLDELIEENVEDNVGDDDADGYTHIESNELTLRKYDLYISYSTLYRVPKLYLVGYNANGIPLLPKQMYEDISGDYKDKTATIENLPMSTHTTAVSIHPCKHASVMKVFMSHARSKAAKKKELEPLSEAQLKVAEDFEKLELLGHSGEDGEEDLDEIRVDWYLVIFLKFIAGVTPGIDYDFTMDAL